MVPILLSLLEKHHTYKQSRVLCRHATKAFSMCGAIMDKKTFSKDLYKFMVFVQKNEKSRGLVDDFFKISYLFNKSVAKSFAVYLPMIVRVIVNVLETPIPNQQDEPSHSRELAKLNFALKGLINMMRYKNDTPYQPMAPFIQRMIGPLIDMSLFSVSISIQNDSLDSLPTCLKLVKLQYGDQSDKTLEIFGKILNSVLFQCSWEKNLKVLDKVLLTIGSIIKLMGNDSMTLDHVKSAMGIFEMVAEKLYDLVNRAVTSQENRLFSINGLVIIYETIGEMVKYNSALTIPIITSSDFLIKSNKKLLEIREKDMVKSSILYFMAQYMSMVVILPSTLSQRSFQQ
ncbi:hypothetical protein DFA_00499 [Cavenderia fasciculata]|uniref:Uncharacterized protein n=1 Tax=Cavenderia fasciculata TaxID=261658 RepID=F4PS92_CACFS|nr:uncharacterized protein DFA_00499 [Cavenderia fasciculata]EGG20638.1 hypothetical protein DFA_00499 [Cavenderia fasciculata]|eukprot:XP_004358488.1 hypothetical protein DFA_00499 [Cavenderia fasciculata]